MEIKCPNCKYLGKAKYGRSYAIEIFLLIFTAFLLWIPLVIYYACTKRWVCPKCQFKNVIEK